MTEILVEMPRGPGRLAVDRAADPVGALLLGHGAGGGIDAFDLEALAAGLPARGVTVLRFEQPWRTAGRKVAGPPASLDEAWRAALGPAVEALDGLPLWVGGRSAGARVACRCFGAPARGVVALSFPLHPPGRPEKSRAAEALAVAGPLLVLQGESDPFGSPAEIAAALPGRTVVAVPGAAHSLKPTRKSDDPAARADLLVATVARFLADAR